MNGSSGDGKWVPPVAAVDPEPVTATSPASETLVRTERDGRDPQTFTIIGAAIEVHRELGPGFLEPVYQEALAIELRLRGIPFAREVALPVSYKGEPLTCGYRADFLCYGEVIVELKALDGLGTREQSQLLNYLKATKLRRGLLINFGGRRIESKRMVA